MVDKSDLTEAERKALAQLKAMRDPSKPKEPISASFRDRMASATVDPAERPEEGGAETDIGEGFVIFRP